MYLELKSFINILLEFEGIIGAVLGSVATLIVTHLLAHSGNLKSYVVDKKLDFITFFEQNNRMPKDSRDTLERVSLHYRLQIYNKSDVYKIMRDFKVDFYKNKEAVFSIVPKDESTRKRSQYTTWVDEMEVANIPANEIVIFKHSLDIWEGKKEFTLLDGVTEIKLSFFDEKDKRRHILLHAGVIDIKAELEKKILQLGDVDVLST